MNLFVFPVNPAVTLDPAFVEYATIPTDPLTLDPAVIDANREALDRSLDRDRVVTRVRAEPACRAGSSPSSRRRRPCSSSCSTSWPFVTLLAHGLRLDADHRYARRRRHMARRVVHGVAGGRSARPRTLVARDVPGVGDRALRVPRPAAAVRGAHRRLRAADGRGRRGVRGAAARFARSQRVGDHRRPRRVQPGGRGADGRGQLVAAAARPRARRGHARRRAVAVVRGA